MLDLWYDVTADGARPHLTQLRLDVHDDLAGVTTTLQSRTNLQELHFALMMHDHWQFFFVVSPVCASCVAVSGDSRQGNSTMRHHSLLRLSN
ncbi:hypothetical protein R3P38DRAFT_3225057 [Favolaschia claudopus]|uniref:Uncharacterized protein n=1 Tax=Favolaschia claudopus TaxID=2862362 RepID=A0AAV9ZUZ1_9AGAR